jgi:hypothetical protein
MSIVTEMVKKEFNELTNANGFYCNYCDKYTAYDDMIHRYESEYRGEYCGQQALEYIHSLKCPNCHRDTEDDDVEEFDYMQWTHLKAYVNAMDVINIQVKYPKVDEFTNETIGYGITDDFENLEDIADYYCIEVLSVELLDDMIEVEVDFQ